MIRVKVGKPERAGKVYITFDAYRDMLAQGGNQYVTVHLEDGEERDWRVKYLREVE